MNTTTVANAARASLEGTRSFPEIVEVLLSAGVEYYHVDYVALRMTFYGADGSVAVAPIPFEGLPAVAQDFDLAAVQSDILDSQRNLQLYRNFTHRAMEAGVQGYFAFLRGKCVTYFGRQGDEHTEWFPGLCPSRIKTTSDSGG